MLRRNHFFPVTFPNSIPTQFPNPKYAYHQPRFTSRIFNQHNHNSSNNFIHQPQNSSPFSHPPGFPEPKYSQYGRPNGFDIKENTMNRTNMEWRRKSTTELMENGDAAGGMFEVTGEEEIRTILISNVSMRCLKRDIVRMCQIFGCVEKVFVHENRMQLGCQFVFVRYACSKEAEKALNRLKGTRRFERVWTTSWARRNLIGSKEEFRKGNVITGIEDEDVEKALDRSWVIVTGIPMAVEDISEIIIGEGLGCRKFIRWGAFGVIVICKDDEEMQAWEQKKNLLNDLFTKVYKIEKEMLSIMRYCWIEIQGIPLRAWSMKTMENLAGKFGEMLVLDTETDTMARADIARIFVETKRTKKIDEEVDMSFRKKWFKVRVQEVNIPHTERVLRKDNTRRIERSKETTKFGRQDHRESFENKETQMKSNFVNEKETNRETGEGKDTVITSTSEGAINTMVNLNSGVRIEVENVREGKKDEGVDVRETIRKDDENSLEEGEYAVFESPIKTTSVFQCPLDETCISGHSSRVPETPIIATRTPIFISKTDKANVKSWSQVVKGNLWANSEEKKLTEVKTCSCCEAFKKCRQEHAQVKECTLVDEGDKDIVEGCGVRHYGEKDKEEQVSRPFVLQKTTESLVTPKRSRGRPKGSKAKFKNQKRRKREKKATAKLLKSRKGKERELRDESSEDSEDSDSEAVLVRGIDVCEQVGVKIRGDDRRRVKFVEFIQDIDSGIKRRKEQEQGSKAAQ